MKYTYEEFMIAVDRVCYWMIGVSIYDLPDLDFRSAWEDGEKPMVFVRKAVKDLKGE